MRAVEAAVAILRAEGISTLFGLPGAAINPFYAAVRAVAADPDRKLRHVLARHMEGASRPHRDHPAALIGWVLSSHARWRVRPAGRPPAQPPG